jgi:cytoskeletal protein RodZ
MRRDRRPASAEAGETAAPVRTPGTLLRQARQAQDLPEGEVAERLNWMLSYVGIIERDDYRALRRPAFARGYVKAYGRLLGLEEAALLAAFDTLAEEQQGAVGNAAARRPRPVSPGRVSALAVCLSVIVLGMLVFGLWWWRHEVQASALSAAMVQPLDAATGEV